MDGIKFYKIKDDSKKVENLKVIDISRKWGVTVQILVHFQITAKSLEEMSKDCCNQ